MGVFMRDEGGKPMTRGWSMRGAAGRPLVLPEWRKQSRVFFMRLVLPWGRSMWEGDMGNRYCVY